jgi:site-specific recombinase XerD
MSGITLHAVPRTPDEIIRFGNGSQDRAKTYLLALYGFLASKPENTRRAYQRGIREFFELWNWISPEKVGVAEAAYYKKWLKARNLSDSTVCLRLSACQSYFDFLMKPTEASGVALVTNNPFRLVTRKDCTPTPYGRSSPTEWADFEKILKAIPDDIAGKRDTALLLFFANTGRRRAEVANLRVKDLNLTSDPKTYIAKVKGNKLQTYELSEVCHQAILDHWISANRLRTLTPESSVFGPINQGGSDAARDPHRCLTVDQVAKILKSNARRAGLDPRKFKLHSLRHMFAHDMDSSGARLQDIQAALGHSLPNTTAIYTGKLRGPAAIGVQKQIDAVRQKASREAEAAL